MRYSFNGVALACLFAAGTVLADDAQRTHEYTLDNGLKLLVEEDHRAHVAVVQVWYRVGSTYEHDGITGISHALEHMMFKGTKTLGPGQFATTVAAKGGRQNAFTSADYTAYYEEWSADNVELSFQLEADRMRNLIIDEGEFKKEINVVLEERRLRTDDNPAALAQEVMQAAAYQTSPYRYPVIGWAADIQQMQVADLRAWYQRWYAPNNAIVVVVGDVDPAQVHALANKHFGPLKTSALEPPKLRPEVEQRGTKRLAVSSDKVQVPTLTLGYKVPSLLQAIAAGKDAPRDVYALDVLAEMLGGDDSARLKQKLVRGRTIASDIGADNGSGGRDVGLFTISATPAAGTALADLERAIGDEIATFIGTPPTTEELERIKTQVVADTIFERDSLSHRASTLGSLEATGLGWRLRDTYVDAIKSVTRDEVLAVARKYLTPRTLTVLELLPEDKS